MPRLLAAIAIAALVITAGGCRQHRTDPSKVASVRVIDAVSGGEELTLTVDGVKGSDKVRYGDNTGYATVDPGDYRLNVGASYSKKPIFTRKVPVLKGQAYTLVILPRTRFGGSVTVKAIHDGPPPRAPKDRAILRVASVADDLDDPSVSLNSIMAVNGLRFGVDSEALVLSAEIYEMKVWTEGGNKTAIGPVSIKLDPGHVYTAMIMGRSADHSLVVRLYDSAD